MEPRHLSPMIRVACFLMAILGLPGPLVFLLGADSEAPSFTFLSPIGALTVLMVAWVIFFLALSVVGRNPFFAVGAYLERQRSKYHAEMAREPGNRK